MIDNSHKERLAFEQGMIEGWRHIKTVCNLCIKAHKEYLKVLRKRGKE